MYIGDTCTIIRAIFNWALKVIWDCIGFALLHSVIGLENLHHPLNQSDAKLKPIAIWSLTFSRTWDWLRVFTLSSHWFVVIFIFVLIGHCDYFGFGFLTLNRKLLLLIISHDLHGGWLVASKRENQSWWESFVNDICSVTFIELFFFPPKVNKYGKGIKNMGQRTLNLLAASNLSQLYLGWLGCNLG